MGGPLRGDLRHKAHLLFPFLADLIRHPAILDAIEDVLGPDILCWNTNFFIKEADNPVIRLVAPGFDLLGPERARRCTAWVALTPSNLDNGAMAVIPGSHTADQIPHRDTFDRDNLLTRGQEIAVEVDEGEAVPLDAAAGRDVAAPRPPRPRLAAQSVGRPPHRLRDPLHPDPLRQLEGDDSATLVRGADRFHHFELEPRPARDMEPAMLALHKRLTEQNAQILYRGTGVDNYNDPRAMRV